MSPTPAVPGAPSKPKASASRGPGQNGHPGTRQERRIARRAKAGDRRGSTVERWFIRARKSRSETCFLENDMDPASRRAGRDTRLLDRPRCPRRHMKQRARQQGDPGAFRKLLLNNNREACRSSAYCDARLHTDAVKTHLAPKTGRSASSSQRSRKRAKPPPAEGRRAKRGSRRRAKAKHQPTGRAKERRGRLRQCAPACHMVRRYRWPRLDPGWRWARKKSARRRRPKGGGREGQGHRVSGVAPLMPGVGIKVRVGSSSLEPPHRTPSQGRKGRALQAMGDVVCTRFMAMPRKRG